MDELHAAWIGWRRSATGGMEGLLVKSVRVNPACAGLLVLLLGSPSAVADPVENAAAAASAAAWLASPTTQNADGSWGGTEDIRSLYTATAVEALRAYGQRDSAYFRGITWLENRATINVDYRARRISALAPHGDDVTGDRDALEDSFSTIPFTEAEAGWGLSRAYAPSPRDSALALLALDAIGQPGSLIPQIEAALEFLMASQAGDGSWPLGDSTTGDPIVTSTVLRALSRYRNLYPSLETYGDLAETFLGSAVTPASTPLEQGHAALALLHWTSGAADVSQLIDALVSAQVGDGSWQMQDGGGIPRPDVYVTAIALRALAAELPTTGDPSFHEVVTISDLLLRSAINLAIGRNRGDALRRGDLESLTSLDARGYGIADLTGLEEATNLTFLDLRNNQVSDATPILGLGIDVVLLQGNPWAGQLCDVVDDGRIDAGDALMVTRIMLGDHVPSLLQMTRSDVAPPTGPGDGVVNVWDAQFVFRSISGEQVQICGN